MRAPSEGFIYATTGELYTALARRSARNLRQVMPDAQIDLFTDQPVKDPVFSKIHRLSETWFRPKMEALIRSRFRRTVFLDADVIPVLEVSDLFSAVDHCDVAAAMSTGRPLLMYRNQPEIPRSYPYLNAGVVVMKRNARTQAMVREWQAMVRQNGLQKDQAAWRYVMYHRRISFSVLPQEYNLVNINLLDQWEVHFGAPRILHVQKLHEQPPGNPQRPFDLVEVLGKDRAEVVRFRKERERLRLQEPLDKFPNPVGPPVPQAKRLHFVWQGHRAQAARNIRGTARLVKAYALRLFRR